MLKPRRTGDPLKNPQAFREALVDWFAAEGKNYPWRRTHDPYAVLVSEVMLQQTQIATVLGKGYFTRFLERFPDVAALAEAEDAEVLKAWEGLGYYRRVRMLRETARAVISNHGGVFPTDLDSLLKLPGVGRYTAGALRAFAFGLPAVLVDGNVTRVLSRLLDFRMAVDDAAGIRQVWSWAGDLADPEHPAAYHAALMELGQQLCRPGLPDCLACPVSCFCKTRAPVEQPVKGRKTAITAVDEHALWLRDAAGRVMMHHQAGKRRTGLWQLPTCDASEIGALPVLAEHRYAITRYRVTLRVHDGSRLKPGFQAAAGDGWKSEEELASLALAAPFRRVIERLLVDF